MCISFLRLEEEGSSSCVSADNSIFLMTMAYFGKKTNGKYTVNLKKSHCDPKGKRHTFYKSKNKIKDQNKIVTIERIFYKFQLKF